MEGPTCDVCFIFFSEDACVPKVLECGHTICLKCLENVLKDHKICPTCEKTLTKSLDEYPTNFSLLNNNKTISKENYYLNKQEMNSLSDKVNLLLLKKETFKNSIEEQYSDFKDDLGSMSESRIFCIRTEFIDKILSLTTEITDRVEKFENLIQEKFERFDEVERKELKEEIDRHIKVKKTFHCNCYTKEKIMLQLSDYKDAKHFLNDLAERLRNDEKIYACEFIGVDGWRYGEITFNENRIHIHCLSAATIENDVFVVSLGDLRKCIVTKEDIFPFIRIGDQKLIFTLTEELSLATICLIKLFTGEGGQTLKGIRVSVTKGYPEEMAELGSFLDPFGLNDGMIYLDASDLTHGTIYLTNSIIGNGYEDILHEYKSYEMKEDEVFLQKSQSEIHIHKVHEIESDAKFYNIVGKLHKDFQIDFEKILNNKVEDSGICFIL